MNVDFLLLAVLLLAVRAVFYSVPIRRTVLAYSVKAVAEIGLLFVFFVMHTLSALAIPGLLLLLGLFAWVFEIHLIGSGEPESERRLLVGAEALFGLVLVLGAMAVVFSSPNAPALRHWARIAVSSAAPADLFVFGVALFVLFELGHLVPRLASAPGRFITFGLWLGGSFLAAAVVVAGSVTLDVAIAEPSRRRREALRSAVSVVLAVATAVLAQWARSGFF